MEQENIVKRPDIVINDNTATYTFRYEGDISGTYAGQFVFKCFLLPSQRLAAAKARRELLGEFGVLASNLDKNLALALTELRQRVLTSPPFWSQASGFDGDIPDTDLIFNVFNAAMDAEEMFKQQKAEEKVKLLESAQKAAEALLAKRQEEKKDEEKTEEEQLEEELEELGK